MKKFLSLFACMVLMFTLAGCGGNDTSGADSNGTYSSSDDAGSNGDHSKNDGSMNSGVASDIVSDVESGMEKMR